MSIPEPAAARPYVPAHDPAIHGQPYAVKVAGHDTQPFAAIKPRPPCLCDLCQWAMNVGGKFDGECRCDQCRYGHRPGTDAVMYTGPDSVLLMIFAAIRDGRYEDIHAWLDEKQHADHAKLDAAERQTRRTLAPAIRALQRYDAARRAAA